MSTTRYATLIGLALGAVLALTEDLAWTLAAALFTIVGFVVGLVLEGRIDIDAGTLTRGQSNQNRTM
jgi:lysylphosphatidylglycerol synthetase-like protein (DUF2156 family)